MGANIDQVGPAYFDGDVAYLKNTNQDKDLIFSINDGGVQKTITWDAALDRLRHSSGLFVFGDNVAVLGDLTVSGVGPHAIGGAVDGHIQVYQRGAFTSDGGSTFGAAHFLGSALTGANGDTTALSGSILASTITTQDNSEIIGSVSQLRLQEPGITKGATDTITNASTLEIVNAPTEGVNNYAFLASSGDICVLSGDIIVGAANKKLLLATEGEVYSGGDIVYIKNVKAAAAADVIVSTNHTTAEIILSPNGTPVLTLGDGTAAFATTVSGLPPVNSNEYATKEYVDSNVNFISEYYFNNTASDIGGIYYDMIDSITGDIESTFSTAGLGTADDQALVNFATEAGVPGLTVMSSGIYGSHVHAEKTVGTKVAVIYFEIYRREPDTTETLIATSELSQTLTLSSKEDINLHATLAADVVVDAEDRIIIKWYANVSGGGSNVTVVLYAEGNDASRLEVPSSSEVLNQVYLRRDGESPLLANWDAGNFDITMGGLILPDDGTISGATEADVITVKSTGEVWFKSNGVASGLGTIRAGTINRQTGTMLLQVGEVTQVELDSGGLNLQTGLSLDEPLVYGEGKTDLATARANQQSVAGKSRISLESYTSTNVDYFSFSGLTDGQTIFVETTPGCDPAKVDWDPISEVSSNVWSIPNNTGVLFCYTGGKLIPCVTPTLTT